MPHLRIEGVLGLLLSVNSLDRYFSYCQSEGPRLDGDLLTEAEMIDGDLDFVEGPTCKNTVSALSVHNNVASENIPHYIEYTVSKPAPKRHIFQGQCALADNQVAAG